MKKDDCIFCKIIKKEIHSDIVYENKNVFVFLDMNPVHKGHALVIPKEHFVNIYEIPENLISELFGIAKKISITIKKTMSADGINITMNNDKAAGQVVFHAHIHIIPRFTNDGLEMWHGKPYEEGEKEIILNKIIQEL